MSNQPVKPDPQDKRAGSERRLRESRPLRADVERRKLSERRQTSVSEISYFEWASHFVKFHGRMAGTGKAPGTNEQTETGDPA